MPGQPDPELSHSRRSDIEIAAAGALAAHAGHRAAAEALHAGHYRRAAQIRRRTAEAAASAARAAARAAGRAARTLDQAQAAAATAQRSARSLAAVAVRAGTSASTAATAHALTAIDVEHALRRAGDHGAAQAAAAEIPDPLPAARCRDCGRTVTVDQMCRDARNSTGLASRCRDCHRLRERRRQDS